MLHVFFGEDGYSVRKAIETVKQSIGDETALMTNTTVLDGKTVSIAELRAACETVPFLADKRLVIVEGLPERFEPAARTGRKKTAKKADNADSVKEFVAGLENLPEFTELVIVGGAVKTTNPLLRGLAGMGKVIGFPLLRPAELKRWVDIRIKESGGTIAPRALETLVRFVGNDLWTMSNEIEKLLQYAAGRTIEDADIRAVVSATQEASVFAMVDAILESRTAAAQDLFQKLLADGMAPSQLLVMINRQVRILYQLKDLRSRKRTRQEIGTALGLTNDFVLNKAWDQADKYSIARLRDIFRRLVDTDLAIKTGRYDAELALTILIAEMGPHGTVKA